MKVLIVFNHPAPYKVRLFNEIAKFVDLDVIFERRSASDRPKEFYNCNVYNFNVTFLKRGAFSKENSNTGELIKYLRHNHQKYDLIIMNGYSQITEMRTIRWLNKHKIPFVLYINGGIAKKDNKIKYLLKKKYISSAKYYLSPCEEANEYLKYYGADPKDIFIYPYSTLFEKDVIEKPLTKNEKDAIRKKWNMPEGRLFISAAQFIERKNNLLLLKMFKGRKDKLLLIGDGPQKEEYLKFIKDNDMKNVTVFDFKKRQDLFEIFKGGDFFITLSKEDIYGHTTNEAFANGLPVISSDAVVSSRHLIKNGVNGYLVKLDNIKEIEDSIKDISIEMSEAAIKTARENTIEEMAKAHHKIFMELKK